MKYDFFKCLFLIISSIAYAQKADYPIASIPDSLKQNANAVIRLEQIDIEIGSQRSMNVKTQTVVTVFNEKGLGAIEFAEDYDKRKSVKDIHATILDAAGKEIKKIKRKDFIDVSPNGGGMFYSDTRIVYLNYTPTQYPFTIVYESETQTSNTAFIQAWCPIHEYFTGVEKSVIHLTFPFDLGFKKKESSLAGFKIKTDQTPTSLTYTATNIAAQKPEDLCPYYTSIFPRVIFGLENFNLEGVDGTAKTWNDFGKWYSDKILTGTEEIPDATKLKIKSLVGNETDPIKKARIVYDYVQQKSRYVAIMVGIGGWRPMPAADVDRLGYGDCKALTNYTRSLLAAVDVPSYYTIVYGDDDIRNIDPDFVSMQGNHAILTIPNGKDYVWLECTSQDTPFGYQAGFTDDRHVLLIKPDGAEIVKTKTYNDQSNLQVSKGQYAISPTGMLTGTISIASEGSEYERYRVESKPPVEKESFYKDHWSNIDNLKIKKSAFSNDREKVRFTENVDLEAMDYGSLSGNRMMFAVNAYHPFMENIKRLRNRKMPFEIARGSYCEDEIAIELPGGFSIEALPKGVELSGKFGQYKTELVQTDANHLVYKRSLLVKKGLYPNKEYEDYRLFMEQVSRNDNAKIVLIKN